MSVGGKGMISRYFGDEVGFSNFLFKVMLVVILAQQVYFPQQLKYMHLALLFITLLFLDVYQQKFREVQKELIFLGMILICGIISILEKVLMFQLSYIYLLTLSAAILMAMGYIRNLIKDSKDKNSYYKFSSKHLEAINKNRGFVVLNFYLVMLVLAVSIIYNGYLMIKIIY